MTTIVQHAVFEHKGVWPVKAYPSIRFGQLGVLIWRSEFEAEAKRMGYINGYKYMEECTEKGKPNLPDDIMVSVMTYGRGRLPAGHVGFWNWDSSEIKSFRIVDERYKPADTSYLNASTQAQSLTHGEEGLTHSEWHQRGELPPVGVECEYKLINDWVRCTPLFFW